MAADFRQRVHLEGIDSNAAFDAVEQCSGLPVPASSAGIAFSAPEPPETSRPEVRPTNAATTSRCAFRRIDVCATGRLGFVSAHSTKVAPTGFTLVELLVVVGIIIILTGLILTGLNKARAKGDSAVCVNNLKQLQLAWQMYVDDHNGRVPENYADLSTGVWRSSLGSWAGPSSAPFDPGDWALRQGTFMRLGYVSSPGTFRCPADEAEARNRDGSSSGAHRSRSYAMNGNFGGRDEESQTVFDRESLSYNPTKVFVFIDEHADSIDDGHFLTWPKPDDRWVNLPAGRHNQSGTLSFADGHVEQWKWRWPKRFNKKQSYWKRAENEADLADLRHLQASVIPLEGEYTPQR